LNFKENKIIIIYKRGGNKMSVKAYILIETEPGKIKQIVDELNEIKEVELVCGVTGPYDIIAYTKTHDIDSMGDLVIKKVQSIKGVKKTMSCLCTYCTTK